MSMNNSHSFFFFFYKNSKYFSLNTLKVGVKTMYNKEIFVQNVCMVLICIFNNKL